MDDDNGDDSDDYVDINGDGNDIDYDIDDVIDNDDVVVVLGLCLFFPLHFLGALKYKPPKCQGP